MYTNFLKYVFQEIKYLGAKGQL